jgi:hypothetical protein
LTSGELNAMADLYGSPDELAKSSPAELAKHPRPGHCAWVLQAPLDCGAEFRLRSPRKNSSPALNRSPSSKITDSDHPIARAFEDCRG